MLQGTVDFAVEKPLAPASAVSFDACVAAALDSLWADDDEALNRRLVRAQRLGWPLLLVGFVLMFVEDGLGPATVQEFWVGVRRAGAGQPHVKWVWDLFSQSLAGTSIVGGILFLAAVQRDRLRAQLVLAVPLLSGITVNLLKVIVQRSRPDGDSLSWPSGHSSSAWSIALVCWVLGVRGRWWIVTACALGAIARVMLERHWPADVIASLGVVCLMTSFAGRLPVKLSDGLREPRFLLFLSVVLGFVIAFGLPFEDDRKLVRRASGLLFTMLTAFWAHDRLREEARAEGGAA